MPDHDFSPDRLGELLDQFRIRARLFHAGSLCGHQHFAAEPGRAFMHVLRHGELEVQHPGVDGKLTKVRLQEPSLLFYARPVSHSFIHAPEESADFVCATLEFDGGDENPLVQALPPVLILPLAQCRGLEKTLELLFAETEAVACGSALLAGRLFEVLLVQLLRWLLQYPQQAGIQRGMLAGLADPRLAKVILAMHRDPAADWTLERMAGTAAMSRSAFAASFKAVTGSTPAAYLSDWRLTRAISLMRSGKPLAVVAAACGFAGQSSLNKAFRQRYGCAPGAWLRQQRDQKTQVRRFSADELS